MPDEEGAPDVRNALENVLAIAQGYAHRSPEVAGNRSGDSLRGSIRALERLIARSEAIEARAAEEPLADGLRERVRATTRELVAGGELIYAAAEAACRVARHMGESDLVTVLESILFTMAELEHERLEEEREEEEDPG
jgi:hypothetical protein